jgi:hypothetical protein
MWSLLVLIFLRFKPEKAHITHFRPSGQTPRVTFTLSFWGERGMRIHSDILASMMDATPA